MRLRTSAPTWASSVRPSSMACQLCHRIPSGRTSSTRVGQTGARSATFSLGWACRPLQLRVSLGCLRACFACPENPCSTLVPPSAQRGSARRRMKTLWSVGSSRCTLQQFALFGEVGAVTFPPMLLPKVFASSTAPEMRAISSPTLIRMTFVLWRLSRAGANACRKRRMQAAAGIRVPMLSRRCMCRRARCWGSTLERSRTFPTMNAGPTTVLQPYLALAESRALERIIAAKAPRMFKVACSPVYCRPMQFVSRIGRDMAFASCVYVCVSVGVRSTSPPLPPEGSTDALMS
mmetsp:Transcript_3674/g.7397  ORF Transcript_3674/g.7397 Transcript_3674/m.7397 type:complete len:291 (+) Transcript_3674:564-1436(+)